MGIFFIILFIIIIIIFLLVFGTVFVWRNAWFCECLQNSAHQCFRIKCFLFLVVVFTVHKLGKLQMHSAFVLFLDGI